VTHLYQLCHDARRPPYRREDHGPDYGLYISTDQIGDTAMKLTPDELAEAVKKIITDNGDILTVLSFETLSGTHSYRTMVAKKMDGTAMVVLKP